MSLNWRGSNVKANVRQAQIKGVDRTMSNAVESAKDNHDWKNRTGTLEGSIAVHQFAGASGKGVSGIWGSQDVKYALVHELGGTRIPARPYLRPAADRTYPQLIKNIRDFL